MSLVVTCVTLHCHCAGEQPGHNWTMTIFWYQPSLAAGLSPGPVWVRVAGSAWPGPLTGRHPPAPSPGLWPGSGWVTQARHLTPSRARRERSDESLGARYKVYIKSRPGQSEAGIPGLLPAWTRGPMPGQNLGMLDQFYRTRIRPQKVGSCNKMMPSSPNKKWIPRITKYKYPSRSFRSPPSLLATVELFWTRIWTQTLIGISLGIWFRLNDTFNTFISQRSRMWLIRSGFKKIVSPSRPTDWWGFSAQLSSRWYFYRIIIFPLSPFKIGHADKMGMIGPSWAGAEWWHPAQLASLPHQHTAHNTLTCKIPNHRGKGRRFLRKRIYILVFTFIPSLLALLVNKRSNNE